MATGVSTSSPTPCIAQRLPSSSNQPRPPLLFTSTASWKLGEGMRYDVCGRDTRYSDVLPLERP
jgi:hypothetical protein